MRRHHVVGLHEGLLRHLPVAPQLLRHVHRLVAPLERDRLEVPVDIAEEVLEGFRLVVRVDEHPPTPAPHAHRRQAVRLRAHRREIPLARHFLQRAVDAPVPAVERAAKAVQPLAVLGQQRPPAVEAGIGEGLDLVRPGAHHDVGKMRDIIDMTVAHVRNVVLMAGHLPNPLPQPLDLQIEEIARVIDARIDDRRPRRDGAVLAQPLGHRMRVHVQQRIIRDAFRPVRARQRLDHASSPLPPQRMTQQAARRL